MAAEYLLRFDDICPSMNWRVWDRIEAILLEHRVRPLLAVVPDNCDEALRVDTARADFWSAVKRWRDSGWTIGVHGYQHTYVSRNSGIVGLKTASEFAGEPLATQRERLSAALRLFRANDVEPSVWVAPGHSFDWNTVAVLRELGITRISDGLFAGPRRDRFGCVWLPQQLWRFRPMTHGVWTVCLHPNGWDGAQLARFESAIEAYAGRLLGFEEAFHRAAAAPLLSFPDYFGQKCLVAALRTRAALRRAL